MKHVYLDNAATTPMAPEVIDTITKTMQDTFGNASTPNYFGRQARGILDQARLIIAQSIKAQPSEIIFTSGGSEGDNNAIISTALAQQHLGKHIISTSIEHEAVLKPLKYLESLGFEVTYLPVDKQGQINLDDFKNSLRSDTILVSVMMVNNEVGAINPLKKIGQLLQHHQAIFHTDAVQGYGSQSIDVNDLQVDLLTTSAHKINGPKMLGFLYERQGLKIPPLIRGGDQETKRRAGTENIPAIAGFAEAVKLNDAKSKLANNKRLLQYKQLLISQLAQQNVDFEINGPDISQAVPNILNLWIKGIPTSILQIKLDLAGFVISGGSACTAGSLEPSHVLQAMFGAQTPRINESIRISFNKFNQKDDILNFVQALTQIVRN
ncbi:cysteine desulfurase family protein [Bombilactobacillus bombi]|uniref:cysteine desulfurase family protein n=1 Tax=Bombilactobacillus bombi TaxID=1303590 RepID=UPI0015E5CCD8|nr:cysteine desulfurase family protein [Bombilactobacillus bombi]MBA1434341.1 cysteine desulfurase [Bombilactobacillus bombi]